MNTEIASHQTADEQELARKLEELAIMQAELADRELFLATLRSELDSFEGRYLREVGTLYAELDDWSAKIAEVVAAAAGTEQARNVADEARAQAKESYAAAHDHAAGTSELSPSPELKRLFREVVKTVHPDNALSDADRAVRNRLMTEANLAFRRGDEDALKEILKEYKSCPESVKGDGVAADLQRVLRHIGQVVRRLAEIEAQVAELTASEIALLMAKVETAATKGQNLLAEMMKDIQHRINLARNEFENQPSRKGPK